MFLLDVCQVQVLLVFGTPTVRMLCVGFCALRGALRRARRRRAWGIFPGDPGVVLDIFDAVSTPHISLQARLRSQNILHIFCTLSARFLHERLSAASRESVLV